MPGFITCSDPDCACEPNILKAGQKNVIGHVVMARGSEQIFLCLLCYLARNSTYRMQGWEFQQQFK